MRRADAATATWAALIGGALGADLILLRRGQRLLTDAARCPLGWALLVTFTLHLARRLGRFDPFSLAARLLSASVE